MDTNNKELAALNAWVSVMLSDHDLKPHGEIKLQALNNDAGFRQYFRLNTAPTLVAVYAPPATEDSAQFIRVCTWLRANGVRAPQVLAEDVSNGFLILEDLGDRLLLDVLDNDSVAGLYGEASNLLLHLQNSPPDTQIFPAYSAEKLDDEMQLCQPWFFEKLLGLQLTQSELSVFRNAKQLLVESALGQVQVVVHRDFHSRNLLVLQDGSLATIDFQDAVVGPWTYDLVSLLKDCYIQWGDSQVENWALAYAELACDSGAVSISDRDVFLREFDWMGLQRHLKVLGIFARLALRDSKTRYLHDLPLVLTYVRAVLVKYAEFEPLLDVFERKVFPASKRQFWAKL